MTDIGLVGAFIGVGGIGGVLGYVLRLYATKRAHDSKDHAIDASVVQRRDDTLARVLERRDEDCRRLSEDNRRLGERYDQARTALELQAGQVGDLAARAEAAIARCEEYAERVEKLETENDECRSENRDLKARVTKLEKERNPANVTPAYDTPAVKRTAPVLPPPMHESVGGYRHGK
jgi:chromosome segregation ATPase